jgi:hypothetical protein
MHTRANLLANAGMAINSHTFVDAKGEKRYDSTAF